MTIIREPAVAGLFYPESAAELRVMIERLLKRADPQPGPAPKALIAPHAGYVYSGVVAASAYARLLPYRDRYKRVVLLGPCHRVACRNIAASGADVFRTPLGDVPLDKAAIAALDAGTVSVFEPAHEFEHSLEVHLPFLQVVLGRFALVPLVVGDASPDSVAETLEGLWDGEETLIVVSSDLSHYLAYDGAMERDRLTRDAIERMDARHIGHDDACGATPVCGLLLEARRRAMQVATLDLRNSGDASGVKDRVVGYGAWMLVEPGRVY
jgi:AmmeMemoRadiSam system protein B